MLIQWSVVVFPMTASTPLDSDIAVGETLQGGPTHLLAATGIRCPNLSSNRRTAKAGRCFQMTLNVTSSFWQLAYTPSLDLERTQAAIATYSLQSVFDIGKKFKHSSQVLSTLINTLLLRSGRLQPVLYRVVDVYDQRVARLFIKSLKPRIQFARLTVKKLRINPSVLPAHGIEILRLCKGLQEMSLDIVVNSTYDQSRLYESLGALRVTTLSMNLASAFCSPTIFLPDLHLLCRIKRLHLTNTWVSQRGLFIGLQELCQLTHLSFYVCPPGELSLHTEVLFEILKCFWSLRVVILWRMEYHDSEKIYSHLKEQDLEDPRIVLFNTVHLAESRDVLPVNRFWELAESVVQWRETNHSTSPIVFVYSCRS